MELHLTATGRHLSYVVAPCYLHPTQVNVHRLNPSTQTSRYLINLPRKTELK